MSVMPSSFDVFDNLLALIFLMAKVKSFWTYASKQAAYILNVFPRKRSDGTYKCSEELWEGRELDDARVGLFVYGCLCYASVGDIMPKGKRCVYLGTAITEGSKACIVLEIESGKIFTSRNVRADECSFPFRQANSLPKIILTDYIPDEVCVSEEKIESEDREEVIIHEIVPLYGRKNVGTVDNEVVAVEEKDPANDNIIPEEVVDGNGTKMGLLPNPPVMPALEELGLELKAPEELTPELEALRKARVEEAKMGVGEGDKQFSQDVDLGGEGKGGTLRRSSRSRQPSSQALRNIAAASTPTKESNSSSVVSNHAHTHARTIYNLHSSMVRVKAKNKLPKTNKISAKLPKIPKGAEAALTNEEWKGAMQREWNSHTSLPSVEVVDWPKNGNKIFRSLWVFDLKLDPKDPTKIVSELDEKGFCLGYKARLVFQGSDRKEGVDHTQAEVFANVLKLRSLRILLSCLLNHEHGKEARVHHIDIKTAFLSAKLKKNIYIYALSKRLQRAKRESIAAS